MQQHDSTTNGTATSTLITEAITQILDEQARGWNAGDAISFSNAIDEQACFTNILGMFHQGHDAFLKRHDMILQSVFKNSKFNYRLLHLNIISEQVVTAETLIIVSGFEKSGAFSMIHTDDAGRMFTRLLQVFVKKEEGWKVVAYHNVDVKKDIPVPEIG